MRRLVAYVVAFVLLIAYAQSLATTQSNAKVYVVADITVHDAETFGRYRHQVADIIRECGGRYLIRAGNLQFDGEGGDTVTSAEGDWNPDRFIVLEFDSDARYLQRRDELHTSGTPPAGKRCSRFSGMST